MAGGYAARVAETVTVTGTGAITLSGSAVTAFQTWFSGFGTAGSSAAGYLIIDNTNNAWETGVGSYNGGNPGILTRNFIDSSTNSLISFAGNSCTVSCEFIPNALGYLDISASPIGPIAMPVSASFIGYPNVLTALTAASFGTIASVANTVRFMPKSVSVPTIVSNLGCNVATALASSQFIVGIYADVNGPGQIAGGPTGNPLVQTSALSGATAGSVLGAASITLLPGYTYWIAYICSSTTVMHGQASSSSPAVLGYGYAGNGIYAMSYINSSFALPNATGLTLSTNNAANPAILQT